ncbi:hypothetical protein LKO27_13025 [Tessaracoccus sp. OS52]|uniref:hypothetical protein n=1 Tax=Tessaracoccus sp. OS52 TaxID=2886691 RepID=UPI001D110659|nr:hypothetical protein [Tessaracoccus sp. OS52]MCC2594328.1 hypothetical protein [Tessaracoccus sp. OS52]
MAVAFQNRHAWFLMAVALIAIAGTLLPEILRPQSGRLLPSHNIGEYGTGLPGLACIAISVSSAVGVLAAVGGKGSVSAQVGVSDAAGGLVASIDSLTAGWTPVGIGLLFAAYVGRECSRRFVVTVLCIPIAAEVINVSLTQITAPAVEFFTFLATFALLFGVVRARIVVVAVLAVLIAWPTVFEIRNQLREAAGVTVSDSVDAFDRLRFDLQYSRALELHTPLDLEVPGFLQHPTPWDLLRYGLVPRFVDPDRDEVSTGRVLNVALGGSRESSYSFGPVTNAYVLEGPVYLFFYYVAVSLLVAVIWRRGARITPIRMVLLALMFHGPLGWFSTFPDNLIGTLQDLASSLPLIVTLSFLRMTRQRFGHPAPVPRR